ncbi:MAG TPA: Holliday junction branch migration protein RuvA [Quisquiliibacterium sp.]|nr:Holliday junction branch migration protein RuvA [Quisquiliibacterium sp.]HPA88369.1 Holliday junction branch migration protein RuvA [Quisquiliibacterium sp.]HQD84472.1 Holliday junction branch migration protein RuvA [Quisquiliibacterium sp.]HQN13144.1 Holliday junction branch migration protein RuvA [Quisquiliibacterium sp.]HQP65083.1 Holliday junction branch migration protein RuvA [Quisquiliibacterium sp.]
MIGRLAGLLLEKSPPTVLIDVGGVGYEVDVPMSTFYDLPVSGQRVVLLVHQVIREDAHLLYGFLTAAEREAFRQLIRISGVGPRTALAVLSGMSVDDLAQTVTLQEPARLTRVPGIGKKTAERLLLELKGKLGPEIAGRDAPPIDDTAADVLRALLALGYSEREVVAATRQLPAGTGVSDGIRQALKLLAKP